MIFRNTQTCASCGAKASTDAKFCPDCGERLAGGVRVCGACNTENRSNAQFCRNCGHNLDQSGAPDLARSRWLRNETDFAVRIEADDLSGLLKRGLTIEPGTQALFIKGGAVQATVAPGSYTVETLPQRIKSWVTGGISERITVLLVDTIPTDLEFNLGGIFTNDPLRIGFTIRAQAEVDEPGKFLINLLRGRERYTLENLRQYLYPEVVQIAEHFIRQHSAQELAENFNLRAEFELALEEALKKTFGQNGLHFLQIRAMQFNLEHIERISGKMGQARLMDDNLAADMLLAEAELNTALETAKAAGESEIQMDDLRRSFELRKSKADLQAKKDYEELNREFDLVALSEETRKVEMEERRAELYARMRQAVMSDKMDEVESTAEFESFLDDVDRQKLLRKKERADLVRTWDEESEDHQRARAHLLAMLQVEQNYELRAAELKLRIDLSEAELESELRLEKMRATKQQEIEFARWEYALQRRQAEAEYERDRQRQEAQLQQEQIEADIRQEEMRRKSQQALGAAESDEEIRQMRAEMELGLDGLRGMKIVRLEEARGKWELEQQQLQFKWDQQRQQMEWDLQKEERAIEMELQRERIQMDYELNRLEKLGKLGVEALISVSDVEQAKVIADLKKTESFKGMTEDQILALAAKDSPEVARALQEKFKAIAEGQANERERELYERLLAEGEGQRQETQKLMQEQLEAQRQMQLEQARTQQQMYDKGMETAAQIARDVAQASQGNQSQPVIVNTPGMVGGTQVVTPTGGRVAATGGMTGTKSCTNCGRAVLEEARHCEFCGHKFEGVA